MSESKGEESTLLLNVIKREEASLDECIKILSKFECCPLCQRTSELINEDKRFPERDYEHEITELKKKNKNDFLQIKKYVKQLQKEISKLSNTSSNNAMQTLRQKIKMDGFQ